MKKIGVLWFVVLTCFSTISRSDFQRLEPEGIFAVSALGIDKNGMEYLLTAEVPVLQEGTESGISLCLFSGRGETVSAAVQNLTEELSKTVIFSHCAVLILGDGIQNNDFREILSFYADGLQIPLAAEVISSPVASKLISQGTVSAPAMGYEIPGVLKQIEAARNLSFRCRIYELGAPSAQAVLPRFFPSEGEERYRFAGWIDLEGETA